MNNALIGFSGFVGGTLLKQTKFEFLYRSTNIREISNQSFGTVVCAGAPAQKWVANREPEADQKKIDELISYLSTIKCNTFVLISTVDVFKTAQGVTEDTPVDEADLHAYGLNRRRLEKFIEKNFENYLIVRLPGLVGPGLRKNVIYDFLKDNNLEAIDSRGVFQFYPMVNLWPDIQTALKANLKLVHLTAEPISVADISELGFNKVFNNLTTNTPAVYDMQTKHSAVFGSSTAYQYSKKETILAVRSYAQAISQNDEASMSAKS